MNETPKPDLWDKMAAADAAEREDAERDKLHDKINLLKRELAAMTAERDALRAAKWDAMQTGANAVREVEPLRAEISRMRPVVEAAQKWRHSNFAGDESELTSAVDTYEAALQVVEQPTKKTCPDPQACLHQGCNQTNDGSLCVSGQLQIIDADEAAK